jgi:hypothetical protein
MQDGASQHHANPMCVFLSRTEALLPVGIAEKQVVQEDDGTIIVGSTKVRIFVFIRISTVSMCRLRNTPEHK